MKTATSIKQVNKALQEKYPLLELVKTNEGGGFFYIHSPDDEVSLKIAGLYSSAIYVSKISNLTVQRWIEEIELLLSDWQRFESERSPIVF
jgi:hypothetical protein